MADFRIVVSYVSETCPPNYFQAETEEEGRRNALVHASTDSVAYVLLQGPGLRTNGVRIVSKKNEGPDWALGLPYDEVVRLTQHVPFTASRS